MIELVFGDSAAGSLKAAMSLKQGKALNGNKKDIAPLTLYLDLGDISDMDDDLVKRKELIDQLFSDVPGVSEELLNVNLQTITRIQNAVQTLEPIRIWICENNPAEVCSLYYICHRLHGTGTPLSVVRIPSEYKKENQTTRFKSTSEVEAEQLVEFLAYEEVLSDRKRSDYNIMWNELVSENAPLRAIISGEVCSAPEDFYDFTLRANMPDGEFRVALPLGKTMIKLPCNDRFLYLRIQAMIKSGELIEVLGADCNHPYSGIVKRLKKE